MAEPPAPARSWLGPFKTMAAPCCWASRTFGKGLIQTLIGLGDGSGLAVTVARYVTPSGRDIQNLGIAPDRLLAEPEPLNPAALMTPGWRRPSSSSWTCWIQGHDQPHVSRPLARGHSPGSLPAGRSPGDGPGRNGALSAAAAHPPTRTSLPDLPWRRIQPLHPQPRCAASGAPSPGWAEPPTTRSGQTPRSALCRRPSA